MERKTTNGIRTHHEGPIELVAEERPEGDRVDPVAVPHRSPDRGPFVAEVRTQPAAVAEPVGEEPPEAVRCGCISESANEKRRLSRSEIGTRFYARTRARGWGIIPRPHRASKKGGSLNRQQQSATRLITVQKLKVVGRLPPNRSCVVPVPLTYGSARGHCWPMPNVPG